MTKSIKYFLVSCLVGCSLSTTFTACVDNDDDVPDNYYASTKLTAAEFLEERPELFSEFIGILKRTPYYSMLSTYGTYSSAGLLRYTLFAPTNEGVERYLQRNGYSSIDQIPVETCDTLARTHIIKKGAFFTTDIGEGALPELNMDDAYIVLSSDSDVTNNNKLVYYINKNSRVVERDDSVTNGVVHVINNTIASSSMLLADKIEEDPALTLFSQALQLTGMADSLTKYIDETYSCEDDSVYTGTMERCTSGSALYTRTFWVGKRYFKYTAFVEGSSPAPSASVASTPNSSIPRSIMRRCARAPSCASQDHRQVCSSTAGVSRTEPSAECSSPASRCSHPQSLERPSRMPSMVFTITSTISWLIPPRCVMSCSTGASASTPRCSVLTS